LPFLDGSYARSCPTCLPRVLNAGAVGLVLPLARHGLFGTGCAVLVHRRLLVYFPVLPRFYGSGFLLLPFCYYRNTSTFAFAGSYLVRHPFACGRCCLPYTHTHTVYLYGLASLPRFRTFGSSASAPAAQRFNFYRYRFTAATVAAAVQSGHDIYGSGSAVGVALLYMLKHCAAGAARYAMGSPSGSFGSRTSVRFVRGVQRLRWFRFNAARYAFITCYYVRGSPPSVSPVPTNAAGFGGSRFAGVPPPSSSGLVLQFCSAAGIFRFV